MICEVPEPMAREELNFDLTPSPDLFTSKGIGSMKMKKLKLSGMHSMKL